ncbi:MAG TPA: type IX secretion system sortase PorU [Edaphocola sp.]|nr:type IX secretion system sortase PorU [Edaphocola sp.]
MKLLKYYILFIGLILSSFSFAQMSNEQLRLTIKPEAFKIDESGVFHHFIPLSNWDDTGNIKLSEFVFEPVEIPLPTKFIIPKGLPDPSYSYGIAQKKIVAGMSIPVFFKNQNQFYKITSFKVNVIYHGADKTLQKNYQNHSVLSSGNWYKISINKRGVYKIDYAFLQSIGVNPASINPNNIRVYGNGGTVMKEEVTDESPDDLVENHIEVHANGSTFGQNDYILFYANGPLKWKPNLVSQSYEHTQNYYENNSYYFLNFDLGTGSRIQNETALTGVTSQNIAIYDDYSVIEKDSISLSNIGKMWFGHFINRNNSINLPVNFSNLVDNVNFKLQMAGVVDVGSISYKLYNSNNAVITNSNITPNGQSKFSLSSISGDFIPSSSNAPLKLEANANSINAKTYLDYIRFNFKRTLSFTPGQLMAFRSFEQLNAPLGDKIKFIINGVNSNVKIWNITDPLRPYSINPQLSGNTFNFLDTAGVLNEFVAFDNNSFNIPTFVSKIENQDLHGLAPAQYLIITRAELLTAAQELALFHNNHYGTTTQIATVEEIYNEFSSGGQDIGGIRNFIKMIYDRGNGVNELEDVLLLGAASFDYKDRISNNTNVVPTYQTLASTGSADTYLSDEYFSLLDDGESINATNPGNYIDIGIGRVPARNLSEAQDYIAKVKRYVSNESFGEWKNNATFITDDYEPFMGFLKSAEIMSDELENANQTFLCNKLYSDAAPRVATAGGVKFPSITRGINNQILNGTFLMDYIGHGSPERWAVEEILYKGDVDQWTNKNKLPIFITATCDFGRFDNPTKESLGMDIVLKRDGGAIAALTTTEQVYPGPNELLNKVYIQYQFGKKTNGQYRSFGDAFKEAKNFANLSNGVGNQMNSRKFVILGDPALRPSLPTNNVLRDKIYELGQNNEPIETDTFKALGKYLLEGHIEDINGNLKSQFNGQVFVTLFDKKNTVMASNPSLVAAPNAEQKSYSLQNSVLFKGIASVVNGKFSINIIIPKDINYDIGNGKLTFYAFDEQEDAAGNNNNFYVGGFSTFAETDNEGPVVKPYIDNNKFRSGDIVSENPLLYVELSDNNGINVSGSSIGHDLIAVVDGEYENPYVLNPFYKSAPNDYTKGSLYYQLNKLKPGKHTITVRAWDIYNNSGEGSIDFIVKDKDSLDFKLYNYPNPFRDYTTIVFQHNQPTVEMEVGLKIFNMQGQLIYSNNKNLKPEGSFTTWEWDGTSTLNGGKAAAGMYMYQLTINTEKGKSKTLYQKLVINR